MELFARWPNLPIVKEIVPRETSPRRDIPKKICRQCFIFIAPTSLITGHLLLPLFTRFIAKHKRKREMAEKEINIQLKAAESKKEICSKLRLPADAAVTKEKIDTFKRGVSELARRPLRSGYKEDFSGFLLNIGTHHTKGSLCRLGRL